MIDAAMHSCRAPAPPLDGFVALLWTSERRTALPHAREWNLPTGCADLIVPLTQPGLRRYADRDDPCGRDHAGGVLQGAHQRTTLRDTGGALAVVGAQLRCGGLAGFFDAPADEFSDRTIPLDALWPGLADALRERLWRGGRLAPPLQRLQALQQALRARLRPAAQPDAWLAWAQQQLRDGTARIGDVQRASGCSPARFIARYRAGSGLAPKRHAELLRFNALLQALQRPSPQRRCGLDWPAAAYDTGYADQSHLVREFRRFAGFTPTDYLRGATAYPSHVACR